MADAKLTVSLKGARNDEPWLVVNASSVDEMLQQLEDVQAKGLSATIGRLQADFKEGLSASRNVGEILGGTTVAVEPLPAAKQAPKTERPAPSAAAAKQAPKTGVKPSWAR